MSAVSTLPRLQIPDGTVEALKWLGLVLMTLDHANKYLWGNTVEPVFNAGRVVMPLFAILLAYNLARPGALAAGVYPRVLKRLGLAGAVASVPFVALGGLGSGWWPLNILATLLVATAVMYLLDQGKPAARLAATALFVVGGLIVEFWWPALAIAVGAWSYCRRPGWPALLAVLGGLAALCLINRNLWAFAALPLILMASRLEIRVPRVRWIFYVFYPLHLAALWIARSAAAT